MDLITSIPQLNNGISALHKEKSCASLQQSYQIPTTDPTAKHLGTSPDKDTAQAANPITTSDEREIVNSHVQQA